MSQDIPTIAVRRSARSRSCNPTGISTCSSRDQVVYNRGDDDDKISTKQQQQIVVPNETKQKQSQPEQMNQEMRLHLLELPDVLIFHIVSYIAGPTHRAYVVCYQLAPLCKFLYKRFMGQDRQDDKDLNIDDGNNINSNSNNGRICSSNCSSRNTHTLWETILKEDYGTTMNLFDKRRLSKRLLQSPFDRVRSAHKLLTDNTEIAYFYLNSLVNGNGDYIYSIERHTITSNGPNTRKRTNNNKHIKHNKNLLSLGCMRQILDQYGPHVRVNYIVSTGGTFLVEVCRAKNVQENVILKCIQELVEQHGAHVNIRTNESKRSYQTPLCVAAVRGMSSVVRYLLYKCNADPSIRCSGRFALHTNKRKSIQCIDKTPIEFAYDMKHAEMETIVTGTNDSSSLFVGLNTCIELLLQYQQPSK